jgi:catecholate siderophore receptor
VWQQDHGRVRYVAGWQVVPGIDTRVSGKLPNYKLEVLYKPTAGGSTYDNFAMSQEPPGGNALTHLQ